MEKRGLEMSAREKYEQWRQDPRFAQTVRDELNRIAADAKEIEDRFYQDLQFGTAGLRGLLGAGTNRMNFYTVARAAEAYARVLERTPENLERGIAISYDSRNYSQEFSELSARIFLKHGFRVYLSDRLRPVPLLSYAIRSRQTAGGIMMTASHNPREYNGFKVYSADGSQLEPEAAAQVAEEMAKHTNLPDLLVGLPELKAPGLALTWLGEDLDQDYNDYLQTLIIDREAIAAQPDLAIVYSPLHGSGYRPVTRALESLGFRNLFIVPEQRDPDGNFPPATYPNPEAPEAMQLALDLAAEQDADLVIATDPDADRLGVAVREHSGNYTLLSGNEIGVLLMDYILSAKAQYLADNREHFCVTSVVSSRLPRLICAHYGVKLYECLTGFKYIAEKIREGQAAGEVYDFGFEESYGYLIGDQVRDKDAVSAAALVCELAAVAACEGQTLAERCDALFRKYRYAAEKTVSLSRPGKAGLAAIAQTVNELRSEREELFQELRPKSRIDYHAGEIYSYADGQSSPLVDATSSNLLIYNLGQLDWFATRPSGTEPKLKIYMGAYRSTPEEADRALAAIEAVVLPTIEARLDQKI